MDAKQVQQDVYNEYINKREKRDEKKSKKSFWASDFDKTLNELFWAWTNVPATNPPSPEKLSMFDVAKLCELHIIKRLQETGFAADLEREDHVAQVNSCLKTPLVFAKEEDEFGHRQIRMEMEREYVPISGYLDGITLNGEPIEVKSTRSHMFIKEIATGQKIGNDHYIGQLAVYMDFLGKDTGWLVAVERSNGTIMVAKVERTGEGVYSTTDCSLGLPEEDALEAEEVPDYQFTPTSVDLHEQYMRWRMLFEKHIHSNVEPPLEFEYKPFITSGLLEGYLGEPNEDGKRDDKKIRSAIKRERVLSAHGWKPQYCNWKDLWVNKECAQKGFGKDVATFLEYSDVEIELMLEFIDCIYMDDRIIKASEQSLARLRTMDFDVWRKKNHKKIGEARRAAGIADITPLTSFKDINLKQAELLMVAGYVTAKDFDKATDGELLSFKGVGPALVEKIRAATHTFIPVEVVAEIKDMPIRRNRNND